MDWDDILQNFIVRHSNKIRRVTKPLRERFGVSYFTYHRIDQEGRYTVLVDRPDWAERYVGDKFYLEDPFLSQIEAFSPGICLLDVRDGEESRILKAGKDFGMDLGALLIERGEGVVEFFGFCGSRKKSGIEKLYLNHRGLMKAFGGYFKKEMARELKTMSRDASSLEKLKGKEYFRKGPVEPDLPEEDLLGFLEDLGEEGAKELSKRERECMGLFLMGLGAKETAAKLGLSPRTVEFYFENIKAKLSCQTKQEIFIKGRRMQDLGIL